MILDWDTSQMPKLLWWLPGAGRHEGDSSSTVRVTEYGLGPIRPTKHEDLDPLLEQLDGALGALPSDIMLQHWVSTALRAMRQQCGFIRGLRVDLGPTLG